MLKSITKIYLLLSTFYLKTMKKSCLKQQNSFIPMATEKNDDLV